MKSSNTSRDLGPRQRWGLPWSLIVLAAFFPKIAHAIDPNRAMSQYIHDRWGTEQGFPRGPVYAITQTTGLPSGTVSSTPLRLEMRKLVKQLPGKVFVRTS